MTCARFELWKQGRLFNSNIRPVEQTILVPRKSISEMSKAFQYELIYLSIVYQHYLTWPLNATRCAPPPLHESLAKNSSKSRPDPITSEVCPGAMLGMEELKHRITGPIFGCLMVILQCTGQLSPKHVCGVGLSMWSDQDHRRIRNHGGETGQVPCCRSDSQFKHRRQKESSASEAHLLNLGVLRPRDSQICYLPSSYVGLPAWDFWMNCETRRQVLTRCVT